MGKITLPVEVITSDKTPRTAIAFDKTSGAKQSPDTARDVLLVGQPTAAATVSVATPKELFREDDGANYFGPGSHLDVMCRAAFLANPFAKLHAVSVADAGVKASGTVAFATTATGNTVYRFRFAGKEYTAEVVSGDTATVIGDTFAAAINADPACPATAANVTGTVTLTAKNGGTIGNNLQMRGAFDASVATTATLSAAALASGTGSVSIAASLAACVGKRYHLIACALDDSTAGGLLKAHLNSEGDAEHNHGEIGLQAVNDSQSTATSLALALNGDRNLVLAANTSESWAPAICAAAAAAMSREEVATRPYNGMILNGILPPPVEKRWTRTETRSLLDNGCTPLFVRPGEDVAIMRAVSTGVKNSAGDYDYSTMDITKIQGFDRFRDAIRLMFETNYPNARWAEDDPDGLLPNDVATPEKVKIDLIDVARDMEAEGTVYGVEALKDQFLVEKKGSACWFSVPAAIVDGMHEKLGKIVNILRLPIA